MSRLPRVTGKEVVSALKRAGFVVVRIQGSHHHLRKPGARSLVTVPYRRPLGSSSLPARLMA
ncbi:MAG: type II toxin-antitoxin system HicA family toxin [Thermanaeromonas sp.]|uniref:type II toxin-antitoxin system HicA family toxin n=1 Tax=Thermanaeromonas sp. TaxID=2003697 RepID=UPI0024398182|nr:type II toxin-antitoxin system HicA family toxin [Thermanaeromonas sp.]MCG0277742.1 type II toxin-antitoxin system HicA family toxin [Thermanaeromonas sp.]